MSTAARQAEVAAVSADERNSRRTAIRTLLERRDDLAAQAANITLNGAQFAREFIVQTGRLTSLRYLGALLRAHARALSLALGVVVRYYLAGRNRLTFRRSLSVVPTPNWQLYSRI